MCLQRSKHGSLAFRFLFMLLFSLALLASSWGQESPPAFSTIASEQPVPTSSDTSLLWQIGTESVQSSIQSFELLGPWLNRIDSSTSKSLQLSEKVWDISILLKQSTSEALLASDSLQKSSKLLDDVTTQIIKVQKQQVIEIWIWRGLTAFAAGVALYFAFH